MLYKLKREIHIEIIQTSTECIQISMLPCFYKAQIILERKLQKAKEQVLIFAYLVKI